MKKPSAINEKLCQGKDVFERMNYLYQASLFVSSQNISLASYYSSILSGCAKKAVLRIEHNVKRSICKVCESPLIPGKTAKVRLMAKKQKIIKTICYVCKTIKRIPIKKKHTLWFDQPESLIEIFDYNLKTETNNFKTCNSRDSIEIKCYSYNWQN
ncbi:PREDICTED: ribonuclease P protein subunit rpr2 [Ceratosolen solmsi marchali]|uniref:Ribonuclease P protein subunit rpr2 n=1 Tax=Ceratosolen solmsi marchali TaxID=326594 RepID=A0AAJ6YSM6_9HYME|nr:PREDICTED: ribonuclease P protein subunit rpr2 [Ceratosolen solmsi marchali]